MNKTSKEPKMLMDSENKNIHMAIDPAYGEDKSALVIFDSISGNIYWSKNGDEKMLNRILKHFRIASIAGDIFNRNKPVPISFLSKINPIRILKNWLFKRRLIKEMESFPKYRHYDYIDLGDDILNSLYSAYKREPYESQKITMGIRY